MKQFLFFCFFHESHDIQINYLIMRNTTKSCTYRYVNLLCYEQHCLLMFQPPIVASLKMTTVGGRNMCYCVGLGV